MESIEYAYILRHQSPHVLAIWLIMNKNLHGIFTIHIIYGNFHMPADIAATYTFSQQLRMAFKNIGPVNWKKNYVNFSQFATINIVS